MKITHDLVWKAIWPTVEKLIEATLAEDVAAVSPLLLPKSEAAAMFNLFGVTVFDIVLKTVLGRSRLAITRAIETENGKYVHVEFVWPDPEVEDNSYTAADLVSVKLRRQRQAWRIAAVNPAAVDFPLTEARAQGILVTSRVLNEQDKVPAEPWLLPVALFGGNLQIPLQAAAMRDGVEQLLLPGLQHRAYGVLSLIAGRQLWRDFRASAKPVLTDPAGHAPWAAAVEFIMSEQTLREVTQASIAGHYEISLTRLLPCVRQIKSGLHIEGLDERYSALGSTQIVLNNPAA